MALAKQTRLEELLQDLASNNPDATTLSISEFANTGYSNRLVKAMKFNNLISKLETYQDTVDDKTATLIANILRVNKHVRGLRFGSYTKFHISSASILATAIRCNTNIIKCDLYWNNAHEHAQLILADAVYKNRYIIYAGNHLPSNIKTILSLREKKIRDVLIQIKLYDSVDLECVMLFKYYDHLTYHSAQYSDYYTKAMISLNNKLYSSLITSAIQKTSSFSLLPKEIFQQILAYLSPKDLHALSIALCTRPSNTDYHRAFIVMAPIAFNLATIMTSRLIHPIFSSSAIALISFTLLIKSTTQFDKQLCMNMFISSYTNLVINSALLSDITEVKILYGSLTLALTCAYIKINISKTEIDILNEL